MEGGRRGLRGGGGGVEDAGLGVVGVPLSHAFRPILASFLIEKSCRRPNLLFNLILKYRSVCNEAKGSNSFVLGVMQRWTRDWQEDGRDQGIGSLCL